MRIDLRSRRHPDCLARDRSEWDDTDGDGLCTTIASDLDGLPVRAVGEWAYEKIYRLVQYFGTFASGMKNQWEGLNYIEVCSGPGRCIMRDDCTEIDGTALAVARNRHFTNLRKAVFIDSSPRVVEILSNRLRALDPTGIASTHVGDYEDAASICGILDTLPVRCLNFVFIDPTECNVPFTTIKRLVAHLKNADLLINVALGTDVNRNIIPAILSPTHFKAREKYERFLGIPGFCARPEIVELARRSDHNDLRRKFAEAYNDQLRELGYGYTDVRRVRHYYHLYSLPESRRGSSSG